MSDQPPPPPPPPSGGGFPPPPPPPPSGFGAPPPAGYTPYQAGGQPPLAGGERAGFWIRFAAAFLDGLIIGIPLGIVLAILGIDSSAAQNLIRLVVAAPYFIIQESSTGQTLGKKVCGIKVVDQETGSLIDQGRAGVRYLISIVSGLACGLGYFWMLWDSDKQTWHDKGSQTYVVKA